MHILERKFWYGNVEIIERKLAKLKKKKPTSQLRNSSI